MGLGGKSSQNMELEGTLCILYILYNVITQKQTYTLNKTYKKLKNRLLVPAIELYTCKLNQLTFSLYIFHTLNLVQPHPDAYKILFFQEKKKGKKKEKKQKHYLLSNIH